MLVTLNEMKTYLGIDLADISHDTFLTTQIEIISAAIEQYCRRKFAATDYVQTFYGLDVIDSRYSGLTLAQYPVISLGDVRYRKDLVDVGTLLTGIMVHKPTGKIFPSDTTHLYTGKYGYHSDFMQVEYRAGYEDIPVLIKSVVYALVSERHNKKIAGIDLSFGPDIQSVSIPGTLNLSFDYSLQNNERKSALGMILGGHVNILDSFRSERAITGELRLVFNEEV